MRSKIIYSLSAVFATVTILTLSIPISADEDAISGTGTQDDPYLISNSEQLLLLKDMPDSCYKLTGNITASDWSGIIFSGILDGDGYKITLSSSSNGFIYTNNGTIKNLSLYAEDDSAFPVLLVRNNYGTIENVHVSGEMRSSKAYYMGSMTTINYESGVIKNSYSTASVSYSGTLSGAQYLGVFAGSNKGTIENCYWRDNCYQVKDFAGENSGTLNGCILGGDYGKSDTAMKLQATYEGWDFDNVWKIDPVMNGGFPCLINEREFIKIPVDDITLDHETVYLEPKESLQLTADILPSDAWDKSIAWSSSDDSVSVTQDGLITGVSLGESIITAAADGGLKTASCKVYVVKRVNQIDLGSSEISIEKENEYTFDAKVLPDDATNKTIIWSSSDQLTATVDNGTVYGLKEGTVTITARSADGGAYAECIVRVLKPARERFDIDSDGTCSAKDAELLAKYVQGHTDTGLTPDKADTNGDGKVTSRDVTALLQYLESLNGGDE